MQVAQIIRDQIGSKAFYMLGAKNLTTDGGNNLAFRIRGSRKVNHINVAYDAGRDLYNMTFSKVAKFDFKTVSKHEGVYADQMHEIIERETGLYTSL